MFVKNAVKSQIYGVFPLHAVISAHKKIVPFIKLARSKTQTSPSSLSHSPHNVHCSGLISQNAVTFSYLPLLRPPPLSHCSDHSRLSSSSLGLEDMDVQIIS
ncbi:hypothetical protein RchiOBHm_Chr6g0265041 [Rosa chinensis]|uniref:Uncharacterized protein n=1 Tax=Rosa chinensis TaxID=74649 RepID=A0A2P6PPC4_ROSCH|nr:hypothetical protein RchiOBHm_Chr6g0265041 [Rosa chinensis]